MCERCERGVLYELVVGGLSRNVCLLMWVCR